MTPPLPYFVAGAFARGEIPPNTLAAVAIDLRNFADVASRLATSGVFVPGVVDSLAETASRALRAADEAERRAIGGHAGAVQDGERE